jgi:hypothetical protein
MCAGCRIRGMAGPARPPSAFVGLRGLYPGKGRGRAAPPVNVRVAGVPAAERGEAAETPAGVSLGRQPEEQPGASGEWATEKVASLMQILDRDRWTLLSFWMGSPGDLVPPAPYASSDVDSPSFSVLIVNE